MSELLNSVTPRDQKAYIENRADLVGHTRAALKFLHAAPSGLDFPDRLEGVHPFEFTRLGLFLLQVNNIRQAYELLAQRSSRGQAFYDETIGLQHHRACHMVGLVLDISNPHVRTGLDIGTGTGEFALRLGKHCDSVVALDVVPELLEVAGCKLSQAGISHKLVEGDCLDLDMFVYANSVDIAVMNGMGPYLLPGEVYDLYQGIYNVLRPEGSLYEYFGNDFTKATLMLASALSPRRDLASLVGRFAIDLTLNKLVGQYEIDLKELVAMGFAVEIISIPNQSTVKEEVLKLTKKN